MKFFKLSLRAGIINASPMGGGQRPTGLIRVAASVVRDLEGQFVLAAVAPDNL